VKRFPHPVTVAHSSTSPFHS